MHFDNASIRNTLVISFLAAQAVADTIGLSQFQRITGFSDACTAAYNTPISGCISNDFINGNPCSQACVAGLEQETSLLNTACRGISTSSTTLIGLFFEGKGVQALCPKIASAATTVISAVSESSTSMTAAASSTQIESSTLSTIPAASPSLPSSISSSIPTPPTSSISLAPSTTSDSSSLSLSLPDSSSTSSPSASSPDSSASASSSSSSTNSSPSSAQPTTTLSTSAVSVQTSINIPLATSAMAATATAGSNFGGEIGNLNGPSTNAGSSLCLDSVSVSLAAGLLLGFFIGI